MITAVLDTNVLASGFVRSESSSPPTQLIREWREVRFVLIISDHIIAELKRTFADTYFRQYVTPQRANGIINFLRRRAELAIITEAIGKVATHPEDDVVLATAASSGAQYLVTGDKRLLDLITFHNVRIVTPRQFLGVLETSW